MAGRGVACGDPDGDGNEIEMRIGMDGGLHHLYSACAFLDQL